MNEAYHNKWFFDRAGGRYKTAYIRYARSVNGCTTIKKVQEWANTYFSAIRRTGALLEHRETIVYPEPIAWQDCDEFRALKGIQKAHQFWTVGKVHHVAYRKGFCACKNSSAIQHNQCSEIEYSGIPSENLFDRRNAKSN